MTTVLDMIRSRGDKEPQTESEWSEYRRKRDARRMKNLNNARTLLTQHQIAFERTTTEDGRAVFYVAKLDGSRIRYFPEEGRWYAKENDVQYGIKRLIHHIKMGL